MGIVQRLKQALGIGPQGLLRGVMPVSTGEPPILGTSDLLSGYESMPWLRAVASKVSTEVACSAFGLLAARRGGKAVREQAMQRGDYAARTKAIGSMRQAGSLQEITSHVFLDALETPNPFMGRIGLLKITNTHLDLIGDAYWIKERNGLGVVTGYWPVPPDWVAENPTPARPTFRMSYKAWQAEIPEREVRWFHEASPANPYTRGSGVGWSLGDEYEVDEYAAKMAKQLFFNRARPDFIVMGGEGSSDKEMKTLERDWLNRLQGFWRAHRPYFLKGEIKIHEFMQPTMDQLVYPNLRKVERDIILQCWGVPPEVFGIQERGSGLVQQNYEGAEYLMQKGVVWPRLERLREPLQREVIEEFDERLVIYYPSPVPEDKRYKLDVMRAGMGAFRVDEWRKVGGEAPLGGEAGAAMMVPQNVSVTDELMRLVEERIANQQRLDEAAASPPPTAPAAPMPPRREQE